MTTLSMPIRRIIAGVSITFAGCLGTGPHHVETPPSVEEHPPYTLEFRKADGAPTPNTIRAATIQFVTKDGRTVSAKDGWLTVDGDRRPIADGAVIVIDADGVVSVREPESL